METLRTFVLTSSATAWPGVAAVAGMLLVPTGVVIFFTAGKWGTGSRKFERVSKTSPSRPLVHDSAVADGAAKDTSSANIDAWDSLSNGSDPTIN